MKAFNQKFVALACAALLSACGGGGGGGDSITTGDTTGQTGGDTGTGTGTGTDETGNSTNVYATVEITDAEFDEFQTTGAALVRPGSSTSMSYTGDLTVLELRNGAFFFAPRSDDTYREVVDTDDEMTLPYSYRYTENEQVIDFYKDYDGVVIEHDGADRLETASNFLLQISQPAIPHDATHLELLYNGEVYKRNDITSYALWVRALEVNGL